MKTLVLVLGLAALSLGTAQAQTDEQPPRATPERRTQYSQRIEDYWREVDLHPNVAKEKLRLLLAEDGLIGPSGAGPEIAVSADSPQAAEITLTALLALRRKGFWKGQVHALNKPGLDPKSTPTLLVVGLTDQLRGPVLTIPRPYLSSLEVVDLKAPAGVDRSLFFTEVTLASQLFNGSEEVEFHLEKLGPRQAKYTLKCFDRKSHEIFIDQLREFLDGEASKVELKLSRSFLEDLPERSAAIRLRTMLTSSDPEQWVESAPLEFFEPGQAAPPAGTEVVNLWISQDMSGPEAAEKLFYALLELLDSTPRP